MSTEAAAAPAVPAVHSRSAALVLLALVSIVWGVHWVVVKIGLEYMPPLTYAALRVATGLVTVIVLLGFRRGLRPPPRQDWPVVGSVGLLHVAAGIVLMNLALQVVPAGRSAVLVYTMPLWVAVLLMVVFRTPPARPELVGLVLGIAGLVLLLNPAVIDWSNPAEVAGTLALLLSAMLWAIVTIHIRRHTWASSPLALQPWQLLVALVPLTIVALVLEPGAQVKWGLPMLLVLLYSGPLATAFTGWGAQSITRSLGSQATGTGFLAVPVIGLASGWLVLGEQLGPADIVAFGLVLGGVAVTALVPRRAETQTPTA